MSWNGYSYKREGDVLGLPGSMVEFFKCGFQKPMDGDQAQVEAHISLPCKRDTKELADEYCFGEAVLVQGKPLVPSWGIELAPGVRSIILMGMGDNFDEAITGIEKDVLEALRPLAVAFHARREKLRAAEWQP